MSFKTEASMRSWVRLTGIFYLAIILIGAMCHLGIRGTLIVPGDAAATAINILNAEGWWRLSIAGDIVMQILDIPVILVLFLLFKNVNSRIALMALMFNIVQTAVLVANKQNLVQVIQLLLSTDPGSVSFEAGTEQAFLLIHLHTYGFSIGLIYFGMSCCLYGYLIYNSGFLPKTLGVMILIAGLSYLITSFVLIVAPSAGASVLPLLVFSLVGEVSFALWLIFKGVNFRTREEIPVGCSDPARKH